jgi:RNase P subunit RPR2
VTDKRWYCQVCGLALGLLRDGDLYPMLGGWRADRHGVLHVTCPKCRAERRWPERAA